jgi:hypothetical protein
MTDTTPTGTAPVPYGAVVYDPAEALIWAADIVLLNGWVQGTFVDYDAAGNVGVLAAPVDATGAIRIAAGLDPDDSTGTTAETLFAAWLTGRGLVPGEPKQWASFEQIAEWNDHPARTLGEVASALRRAAGEITADGIAADDATKVRDWRDLVDLPAADPQSAEEGQS